jgi:hypothetical protein
MPEKQEKIDRLIESRAEIIELLTLATEFKWKFSFCLSDTDTTPSHVTEILHVTPKENYLTVGAEINSICPGDGSAMRFLAQDAGISVGFDTQTIPFPGNPLAYRFANERRIAFPKKLTFKQSRQSERLNFAHLEPIPVALFTDKDVHLAGVVEDLSTTGIRARLPGYMVEQFENQGDVVADCILDLPDNSSLQCRIEVLGNFYEFTKDASFIRGRFIDIDDEKQAVINNLIDRASKEKFLERTA